MPFYKSQIWLETQSEFSCKENKIIKNERIEFGKSTGSFVKMITLLNSVKAEEDRILYSKIKELESIKQESYLIAYILIPVYLILLTILFLRIKSDIKIRISTENELKMKSERLENINRNRNKFYSIIAHDLRTPFQPILLIADILKNETKTMDIKEINEFGEKLSKVGTNTLNLLDNLLAWSKVRTGRMQPRMESIMLKEKVDYVIHNLKPDADIKKINLLNEVEHDLLIHSDHEMFSSLLQNLISNAIKFTLSNGVVRVHAKKNGKNVLIRVSDNGVGIPEERIEKIFNCETNFSTIGTNNEKGSGLGLPLCKEYVEIHKGEIWVESKPGDGTTFYFTMPLQNNHAKSFASGI